MKTPTIQEIAAAVNNNFFSRDTLKFFGQTMGSFRVARSPKGNVFIYAPMWDKSKKLMGYTFRRFTGTTLETISPRKNTLTEVLSYIKEN